MKGSGTTTDTQPSKGGATYMDVDENGADEAEVRYSLLIEFVGFYCILDVFDL